MLVAVDVKITSATELHSCFSVALRIKLDKMNLVADDISNERYKVAFSHRVMDCDKLLVLDGLNGNSVVRVDFLSLKGRESYTATADNSCPCSMDDITAYRTDIKLRKENV